MPDGGTDVLQLMRPRPTEPRPYVIVVDDDDLVRQVVTELLTDAGYAAIGAADGQEALQLVERRPPDLVLLDLLMPRLDGWAFCAAVRERGLVLPIALMSAVDGVHWYAARLRVAGAIKKPFEMRELLNLVATCIGTARE